MPSARPLFRHLQARQWLNLAWAALAAFYVALGGWLLATGGVCDYMGADYRAFYASGQIAYQRGFPQVYNLQTQEEYQRPLYALCGDGADRAPYVTVPMPYLPAFVFFFLFVVPTPYMPSYFIWIAMNLALVVLYMVRFARALGPENGRDILPQLLICLPLFSNVFLGQVNGWLLICLGEFVLAYMDGKEFRAGLWLAGLLLKPQTLMLIGPGLLIGRRWKSLAGLSAGGVAVAGISALLAEGYGLADLAVLIWRYVQGLPTNAPEAMMNWRALTFNLDKITPPVVAWTVPMIGLALTAVAALSLWVRPSLLRTRLPLVLFGTYAATCAVAWHAHTHMVLPLIPLVLYLYARREMPWPITYVWLLGPSAIFPIMLAIRPGIAYNLFGVSMLALNVFLTGWTVWTVWRRPQGPTS